MKVLLVGNYQPDRQYSMQAYAAMLAEGLRERGHDVDLLQPPDVLVRRFAPRPSLAKWAGYVDKFVLFRSALKRAAADADVVHICDHSNAMYVPVVAHRPHVVTCHDILAIRSAMGHFPENRVGATGRYFQRRIAQGLRQARQLLCVSQKTRDDLLRYLGIAAEQLEIVPNALHWGFSPMEQEVRLPVLHALGMASGERYFLSVGGDLWYKNRATAIAIFAELRRLTGCADTRLVMVGGMTPELDRAAERYGVRERIFAVRDVTNEQLRALYSGAQALLFPSREEGFGWPILEAQACGCLVAIADRPPMNQIAGGGAVVIDLEDPRAAAVSIAAALEQPSPLRSKGAANAALYTRQRMLDAVERLYQQSVT